MPVHQRMEWKALHTRGLPGELQRYKKEDDEDHVNGDDDNPNGLIMHLQDDDDNDVLVIMITSDIDSHRPWHLHDANIPQGLGMSLRDGMVRTWL